MGTFQQVYNQSCVTEYNDEKWRNFCHMIRWMMFERSMTFKQMDPYWTTVSAQIEFMYVYWDRRQGRANGNTCKKVISTINSLAVSLDRGYNTAEHPIIRRLKKGMNRAMNYKKHTRKPLNRELCRELWFFWKVTFHMSKARQHGTRMMRTIMTMLYEACLRGASIFKKDRAIRHCDLRFEPSFNDPQRVYLTITKSKTNQFGAIDVRLAVCMCAQQYCCLPHALQDFMRVHKPYSTRPVFTDLSGNQPESRRYRNAMRRGLTAIGVEDEMDYGIHSARIGKATDMSWHGASKQEIKRAGFWKSEAYRFYLRTSNADLSKVCGFRNGITVDSIPSWIPKSISKSTSIHSKTDPDNVSDQDYDSDDEKSLSKRDVMLLGKDVEQTELSSNNRKSSKKSDKREIDDDIDSVDSSNAPIISHSLATIRAMVPIPNMRHKNAKTVVKSKKAVVKSTVFRRRQSSQRKQVRFLLPVVSTPPHLEPLS